LDVGAVLGHGAEVVVLATGARPVRPSWADGSVVDATDVLCGRARPAGRVLVVDELGTQHATSAAELLALRGCAVTTVTAAMVAAQHLSATLDLPGWRRRASALGIVERTDLVVQECADGRVVLLHHPTGRSSTETFDVVVHCGPAAPDDRLWHGLSGAADVHRVGDCLAARDAHAATTEGHRVGSRI
ncbi:MAG: mycofactocin system FadH/OYE family oxidoreductase 2, partial [Mycobacteriaceae bacterium]